MSALIQDRLRQQFSRLNNLGQPLEKWPTNDSAVAKPSEQLAMLICHKKEVKRRYDQMLELSEKIEKAQTEWSDLLRTLTAYERGVENEAYTNFKLINNMDGRMQQINYWLETAAIEMHNLNLIEASLQSKIENVKESISNNNTNNTNNQKNQSIKLPTIEIEPFNGNNNKQQWSEFWEVFNVAIDLSTELTTLQKFSYLRSYLKGSAKQKIAGLQLTESNYTKAIELLKNEYAEDQEGRRRKLYSQLISMKPCQTTVEVKKMHTELESICRQLRNVGEDIESPTIWLAIEQKLTRSILRGVLMEKEKLRPESWNTTQLLKSLSEILRHEELLNEIFAEERRDILSTQSIANNTSNKLISQNFNTTTIETTNFPCKNTTTIIKCTFCSLNHYNNQCLNYKTIKARNDRAKQLHLCLRCLRSGHQIKDCTIVMKPCYTCKNINHHSAFCPTYHGIIIGSGCVRGGGGVKEVTHALSNTNINVNVTSTSSTTTPSESSSTKTNNKKKNTQKQANNNNNNNNKNNKKEDMANDNKTNDNKEKANNNNKKKQK